MIRLSSFHVTETYGGLLACSPEILKEQGLAMAGVGATKHGLEKIWGERRFHTVVPKADKLGAATRWKCLAWLDGPARNPIDPKRADENLRDLFAGRDYGADGAELVVVWFQDSIPEDPLRTALAQLAADGKTFAELAEDYRI